MNTLLVIEDDTLVRSNILDLLEAEGYTGIGAEDGKRGVELAVEHLPDLVICDVTMAGIDGFEVYELLSARPETAAIPFIFLSARADRSNVRRGMSLGADDYVTKPFTRSELLDSIRARLRRSKQIEDRRRRSSQPLRRSAPPDAEQPVIADPAMKRLYEQLTRAAVGPIAVLILGETGVGKELLAQAVHAHSGRTGKFVALNCAALNENLLESELFGYEKGAFTGANSVKEGLIETADGGTLFLDEVGDLPATTQVKLLRVLEERKVLRVGGRTARSVDIRLVSATHRDLERAIQSEQFRADLFYRLNGIALNVPPLRERKSDIGELARHFAARAARELHRDPAPQLAASLLETLAEYAWPGNIRELRNVIERAVLLCDGPEITQAQLPAKLTQPAAPRSSETRALDPRALLLQEIEAMERARVIDALEHCGGNQTQAAELLGISRRTLVTRLGQYNLPRPRLPNKRAL